MELDEIIIRINQIKNEIQNLSDLRPGSITQQYGDPKNKKKSFYQINYTSNGKFKTDYVKKDFVIVMKKQTEEYKKLKKLLNEWMELGIRKSKFQMKTKTNNND